MESKFEMRLIRIAGHAVCLVPGGCTAGADAVQATREIVGQSEDGLPIVARRRFPACQLAAA